MGGDTMKAHSGVPQRTRGVGKPRIEVPLRTTRGLNERTAHWAQRYRQVQKERIAVGWYLNLTKRPQLPCEVHLTRCTPSSRPLDDDNLRGAMKAVRDAVAEWLGVDDGNSMVRYSYAQKLQQPWGVVIEFGYQGEFDE